MPHSPPYTKLTQLDQTLARQGYALLDGPVVLDWLGANPAELEQLHQAWSRLPPDPHLRDGGRYRYRRHASFRVENEVLLPVTHRAHWQPLQYNALHGGMERWFDPIEPETLDQALWQSLILRLAGIASRLRGSQPWFVEAHPFRIDTTDGIGRPTPEGAHRDGVDLVAIMLLARHAIKGGESRIFDADGPHGLRFTLDAPASLMLLDDARVIHETTPIQPLDPEQPGWRDTLVLTYRSGGFQGPDQV
ncbi:MAG: 2OG-Fe dioxygenase family protein [Wenzhouxiangella sp.]|nr:2OG-Fe dioxygenase family protein [Wenzhouxiangella sp.]TVR99414.1 MAG: hypothetical protein EA418_00155 [Wenzhouxiangellaceae bacterium]